jgi:arabinosaccharide transport system substrate-binding protein
LSQTGLEARLKVTNILPPVMEMWKNPAYHEPDAFFGGQKIMELYTQLAPQIPPRYVSAATLVAQIQLSVVVDRAVKYYQAHGNQGLEAECQKWLDLAAGDLKRRIENGRFED